MRYTRKLTFFSFVILFSLVSSVVFPTSAFADDTTPPPVETSSDVLPPTAEPVATEIPATALPEATATEQPVLDAPATQEAVLETASTEEVVSADSEEVNLSEIVSTAAEQEIILADESGDPLVLSTLETAETLADGDPQFIRGGTTYYYFPTGSTGCVGKPAGTCFYSDTPIQAALDDIELNGVPDDLKLLVGPGTYNEQIVIETPNLMLIGDPGDLLVPGAGAGAPVLDGSGLSGDTTGITIKVEGVTISGFIIRNYDTAIHQPVVVGSNSINILNNTIENNGDGIDILSDVGAPGTVINYNIFRNNTGNDVINGDPTDNNVQYTDIRNNDWGCTQGPVVVYKKFDKVKGQDVFVGWRYRYWATPNTGGDDGQGEYISNPNPDCALLYGSDDLWDFQIHNQYPGYSPYKFIIDGNMPTSTPTNTPLPSTPTDTPTSTPTNTPVPPTPTDTPTSTPTDTPVPPTPTDTPTSTPTGTSVPPTPTDTPTSTPTDTPVPPTPTDTPTNTPTNTPVPPTSTNTPTNTPTSTAPAKVTPTNTPTNTPVPPTSTNTPTNTPTDTPTSTPTDTPVPPTPTDTPTNTPTDTPTSTPTDTPTSTPTNTPTSTPTNTPVVPTSTPTDRPERPTVAFTGFIPVTNGEAHAIAAGIAHTCAITPDGGVQCWGNNTYGQLGDGTNTASNVPVDVLGISGGSTIVAGGNHTCVLTGNDVWCWGQNSQGQIGDGTKTDRNKPVKVLTNAVDITAGLDYTCAVMMYGQVMCWGNNDRGQLANGSKTDSTIPTLADLITGISNVDAGQNKSCGLTSTGLLRCLDSGIAKDLGGIVPVTGQTPDTRMDVAVNRFGPNVMALNGDGEPMLYQTGKFQLVDGVDDAIDIDGGLGHICTLLLDGTVKCWGQNTYGQLGINSRTNSSEPQLVLNVSGAWQLAVGRNHACVLITSAVAGRDDIQCWGLNKDGQLGNGTNENSLIPVFVVK